MTRLMKKKIGLVIRRSIRIEEFVVAVDDVMTQHPPLHSPTLTVVRKAATWKQGGSLIRARTSGK